MLGDEIRKSRLLKGMTQEQLSLASGVDRAYLSEMERNRRSVSVEVLTRIGKALGESAGVLLGRAEGLNLIPSDMKGLARLVYDEKGVLTKIVDDRGRVLVAGFSWASGRKQWYTAKEAAEILGVGGHVVRNMCVSGMLVALREPNSEESTWMISHDSLERVLHKQQEEAAERSRVEEANREKGKRGRDLA